MSYPIPDIKYLYKTSSLKLKANVCSVLKPVVHQYKYSPAFCCEEGQGNNNNIIHPVITTYIVFCTLDLTY